MLEKYLGTVTRWIETRLQGGRGADGESGQRKPQSPAKQRRLQVHHDTLTGLPRAELMEDRLDLAIALAARSSCKVAVMSLTLDDFAGIAESRGSHAADRLLQGVAHALESCLRNGDSIGCRDLGQGWFMVLLPALPRSDDAAVVAEKLRRGLESPVVVDGDETHVRCSIGIGVYPTDGADAEAVIAAADAAMGQARRNGGNAYKFMTVPDTGAAYFRWPTGWAAQ